jgi:hypothetical protein
MTISALERSASAPGSRSTSTSGIGTAAFYPGLHPRQHLSGTAATFDEARACFEADWKALLPDIPDGALEEYRHDRDQRAEMRAKPARGEKLDSEIPSSIMRCVCGIRFDSHEPAESYDHRGHIYAAQQQGIHW